MSKFHKAVEIVENLGFEFVNTDKEANIIIKTPDVIIEAGKKRQYQIIRASHICEEQIRFAVFSLLELFQETEDKDFLTKHSFNKFEGKLGENDFKVKIPC